MSTVLVAIEQKKPNHSISIFTEPYPPYTYMNSEGEVVGETAKIITAIMRRAGVTFVIEVQPWKRSLAEQKNTPDSLIYPLTRNKHREASYQWLVPLVTLNLSLYGLSEKFDSSYDVKTGNHRFACFTESSFCNELEAIGIPESSILKITNIDVNKQFELLQRGRIDFVIASEATISKYINKYKIPSKQLVKLDKYQFIITDYLASNINSDPELNGKIIDAAERLNFGNN